MAHDSAQDRLRSSLAYFGGLGRGAQPGYPLLPPGFLKTSARQTNELCLTGPFKGRDPLLSLAEVVDGYVSTFFVQEAR